MSTRWPWWKLFEVRVFRGHPASVRVCIQFRTRHACLYMDRRAP